MSICSDRVPRRTANVVIRPVCLYILPIFFVVGEGLTGSSISSEEKKSLTPYTIEYPGSIVEGVTGSRLSSVRKISLVDLLNELKSADNHVRARALAAISRPDKWPNGDGAALIAALGERLTDKEVAIRTEAARTLGRARSAAVAAVPALVDAANDESAIVRGLVYTAIGRIGPAAKDAMPTLVRALGDKDEHAAGKAALALEDFGAIGVLALIAALENDRPQVIKAAAFALGGIGRPAKDALPRLKRHLGHPDLAVAATVRRAIDDIQKGD